MTSTNAMQKHPGLKPMQQTTRWTFNAALSILNNSVPPHIHDALDEFLIHSKDVILLPLPFQKSESDKPMPSTTKETSIRGVLFTDVELNVPMANELSEKLCVDSREALRVISQTQLRIPVAEESTHKLQSLTFKLTDDRGNQEKTNSLVFYASVILRERRTVVQLAAECFRQSFLESSSSTIRNLGRSIDIDANYLSSAISCLHDVASSIQKSPYDSQDSTDLDTLVYTENILYMLELLGFLCEVLLTIPPEFVPVKLWFEFMDATDFMVSLGPRINNRESFVLLQALSTIVTLQVLNLNSSFDINDSSYLNDGVLFAKINEIVVSHESNSIVSYAWLITLFKKSVIIQELKNAQESFTKSISHKTIQSTIATLVQHLESASVFEDIILLHKFLNFSDIFSAVLADLLTAALPVMPMTAETATCVQEVLGLAPPTAVEKFFASEEARNAIILARAKFPVLISPYLKLISINGKFAHDEMAVLNSYMSVFNKADFERMYEIDSENTDLVKLSLMIDIYPPYELKNKMSLLLKPETKAKIVPSAQPDKILVTFLHTFSGWAFLGRVTQNISKSFNVDDKQKLVILQDILQVLCKTTGDIGQECQQPLLDALSAYIDDSDIVEILFRLFEQGLHNRSVVISEHLLRLFTNLLPSISSRLWPYLSNSSLLLSGGKESFMSVMFGSIEMIEGDYSFTIALTKFVHSLTCHSLHAQDGYPESHKSEILLNIVDHLVLLFESFSNCKFNDGLQRLELGVLILDAFRKILEITFNTTAFKTPAKRPVCVFHASARRILDAFLVSDGATARAASPILQTISHLAQHANYYEFRDVTGSMSQIWIKKVCTFSELLIDIRSILDMPPSQFERDWFTKLQDLVTIYARGSFKKPILDLITALSGAKWDKEPMPLMLSHLGMKHSEILLHSLAFDLDNAFESFSIKIAVYDLICSIMEANQQGMSVLFISGRNVFGDFKNARKNGKQSSLLVLLMKNVHDIKYYPATVTTHLLDAIALAFNSWTVSGHDESDLALLDEFFKLVKSYEVPSELKTSEDLILASYQNKVFAKTLELLSYILFTSKEEKIQQKIVSCLVDQDFISKLPGFFSVKNHRLGLRARVFEEFEVAFPGFQLAQFESSFQKRNRYGNRTVYDLEFMDSLFGGNDVWPVLSKKVEECSANIQNFVSQVDLVKSLGALLTSFCRKQAGKLLADYFALVPKLLAVDDIVDDSSDVHGQQLGLVRAELAFLITFSIHNHTSITKEPSVAMDIIREAVDILGEGDNAHKKDTPASKLLYRLLFIALLILKDDPDLVVSRYSVLDGLFRLAVAAKASYIIVNVQNAAYHARAGHSKHEGQFMETLNDLRLILCIFKQFVELPLPRAMQAYFLKAFEDYKTVEHFLGLYSFSHLILVDDQPAFSYYSLMFLQTLLNVEVLAEAYANTELFKVLRASYISKPLREGGVSVESSPQLQRNWTEGILPILTASFKGPGDKAEVIKTLADFGNQIAFCIDAWSRDSSSLRISSALTWETTQILFIYKTLKDVLKAENVHFEGANGVDMAILPGLELPQKREDFVDYVSNLLKHPKFLSSRIVPSSVEEVLMMADRDGKFDQFVAQLLSEISELKEFFK